jgi:uncharacterized protein YodC (DUF2158 family)
MANEFKPGDVVQMKSGGPKMTVFQIGEQYGETKVFCTWLDGSKKHEEAFYPAVLKTVGE